MCGAEDKQQHLHSGRTLVKMFPAGCVEFNVSMCSLHRFNNTIILHIYLWANSPSTNIYAVVRWV